MTRLARAGLTRSFLSLLESRELAILNLREWPVFAGKPQRPPLSNWRTWLLLGGRGAGKTRAGAEWLKAIIGRDRHVSGDAAGRVAIIGETYSDARAVMIEGESGLLSLYRKCERPTWNPSRRQLVWPDGTIGQVFSASDPEGLRGSQFGAAWLDEFGCAAITMGANQPNVFADPKSDDSGLPRFSTGARSDLVQSRYLSVQLDYWSEEDNNPDSSLYSGKMIDTGWLFPWAWDARPFPQFPADSASWSDGTNWHAGHWLNGRLGGCPVDELVTAIATDYGEALQASCDGFVDGYVVQGPVSARDALEPLASLFGLRYSEEQDKAVILDGNYANTDSIASQDLVQRGDEPIFIRSREHANELPAELSLGHRGIFSDYEQEDSYSRRVEGESDRTLHLNVPAILPSSTALGALDAGLRDIWQGREKLEIGLPNRYLHLSPGDVITIDASQENENWRIESIEDGDLRRLQLRAICRAEALPVPVLQGHISDPSNLQFGNPQLIAMNLPIHPEISTPRFHIAISAEPWARQYAIWSSPTLSDFSLRKTVTRRSQIGTLLQPLGPGPEGRWDNANEISIQLSGDPLESKSTP
ncbi:MAG: glycoside hydrolase TIM-barrel-like domain-containing protein, partial [Pseudomonadota bacterium]